MMAMIEYEYVIVICITHQCIVIQVYYAANHMRKNQQRETYLRNTIGITIDFIFHFNAIDATFVLIFQHI